MKPIARKNDLVIQETGGEILVYDLRTNKAICLNQTSALVWQNCDGTKDALEIAQEMEKVIGKPVNEDLVWFAVNQLKKENIIENSESLPKEFDGFSRREIIKRFGTASLVAIPVVASLVAPAAAQTGTCPAPGSPCTPAGNSNVSSSVCCSGICSPQGTCSSPIG